MGLLTALGLIIGYIEFLIPIPLGIPGVKPGFANIVIVWVQSGRSIGKLSVHVSGKEKWAFQYDRCQYDRWCHAQYGAASGGYGGAGNSKSGLLWTGASGCGGDHRASDRHRDWRSEEEESGRIGEKDRIIVRKRILCILFP